MFRKFLFDCALLGVVVVGSGLFAGCAQEDVGTPPPADAFHYPVSVALFPAQGGAAQTLYVASSNFDLLYNRGSVLAIDLSALDLDATNDEQPLSSLIDPSVGRVTIDSFAGMMLLHEGNRLFVPTRSGHRLFAIDANGPILGCARAGDSGADAQDCVGVALSRGSTEATDPFAIAAHDGAIYVTHGTRPESGQTAGNSMLAKLDPDTLGDLSFIDIGPAPSEGIIDTPRGLYFTGRAILNASEALRSLVGGQVFDAGVTLATGVQEGRGLGLSSDGERLYMLTRGTRSSSNAPAIGPDGLLTIDISVDPISGLARNQVLSFVELPEGASQMAVLPRPGKRDLLAVSCTDSGLVILYDGELGVPTGAIPVETPYGIAWTALDGVGARLFVASFKAHSVEIIDLPDLEQPQLWQRRRSLNGVTSAE
ncbi:MAG: hypothetical protein LBM75_10035 [Myxococcales bacterium]|jgi:hypothetical protein|nr:hypothetical protein [Myxococcales bacterium]